MAPLSHDTENRIRLMSLIGEMQHFTAAELVEEFRKRQNGDIYIGSIDGIGGLLRHLWRDLEILDYQFGVYRVLPSKLTH